MKAALFISFLFIFASSYAKGLPLHSKNVNKRQIEVSIDSINKNYQTAFTEIQNMLENKIPLNFKKSVFISENAFFDNQIEEKYFNAQIDKYVKICNAFLKANRLPYKKSDSVNTAKNAAIFRFMTDTIWLPGRKPLHYPYTYDFDDYQGQSDWSNMFVIKLIETGTGNCHSLPFLYKIISEELNAKAYLSLAPNHIFIKNYCSDVGWYNTELTSAMFPVDAWVAASGYVTLEAIQNGIYLDTLGLKQSVVLCLLDLAKGYERKLKENDGAFILSCCDLALKHYPNFINAMLLKAETLRKQLDKMKIAKNAKSIKEIFNSPEAKQKYEQMENLYATILKLGYREMPEAMYRSWMLSLKENREKLQDKRIITNFKPE